MDHLLRAKAPISDAGWAEIEEEATRSLKHYLAARKVVDFSGPHGWTHTAVASGRVEVLTEPPADGVAARRRRVLPMIELRVPFSVARSELEAIDRGAKDPGLDVVVEASRRIAEAEDRAVFHGYGPGAIEGMADATPHDVVPIVDDYNKYPQSVARALGNLKEAGVAGPYALALGPRCYRGVIETTEYGGYPLLEHLRLILGGPVVWAPAVDGAIVLSQRGGDFELTVGQDLSIGYLSHDADQVQLYLEESIAFQAYSPEAAIRLAYPS